MPVMTLSSFISFNSQNNPMRGYCYYPHFALSESEVISNLSWFTQTRDCWIRMSWNSDLICWTLESVILKHARELTFCEYSQCTRHCAECSICIISFNPTETLWRRYHYYFLYFIDEKSQVNWSPGRFSN